MKTIHLFFLCAEEDALRHDNDLLGDFIGNLNRQCKSWDIYFRLHSSCEEDVFFDEAAQTITESVEPEKELYLFAFDRAVEDTTVTAMNALLGQLRDGQKRSILIFFKAGVGTAETAALKADILKNWLHYVSEYSHIDSLKLRLITSLSGVGLNYLPLTCKDGEITLGGEALMTTENIPAYTKSPILEQLLAEKRELEPRYLALKEKYLADNDTYYADYSKAASRYHALLQEIVDWEKRFFEDTQAMTVQMNGERVSPRQARAWQLREQGKYEEALAMLDSGELDTETESILLRLDTARLDSSLKIGEYLAQTVILQEMPTTPQRLEQIRDAYEKAAQLVKRAHVRYAALYEYSVWLHRQNEFSRGIQIMEQLIKYHDTEDIPEIDRAENLNLLGRFYFDCQQYEKAFKIYQRALEQAFSLAEREPLVYTRQLAGACENMGNACYKSGYFRQAEELYAQALSIRKALVKDSVTDLYSWAITCCNYGLLCKNLRKPQQAEMLYRDALDAFRYLIKNVSKRYLSDLASLCNNFGILCVENGNYPQAEAFYSEALEIARRLAEENPAAYQPLLGRTANNYAILCMQSDALPRAGKLYQEGLWIYRNLAAANPDVFLTDLASSCCNYGVYLEKIGETAQAERLHLEALELYHELAQKAPAAFLPLYAGSCKNCGLFYLNHGLSERAIPLIRTAVEHYHGLNQALNNFYFNQEREAEQLLTEALRQSEQVSLLEQLQQEEQTSILEQLVPEEQTRYILPKPTLFQRLFSKRKK